MLAAAANLWKGSGIVRVFLSSVDIINQSDANALIALEYFDKTAQKWGVIWGI